jgi:hypothetical protein
VNGLLPFVERVKGFHEKPVIFKIEVFSWYLHQIANKERFRAVDLLPCFDAVHSQRPANIHGQLNASCKKKPARLLKDLSGYRLSAIVRDEMQRLLPARESAGNTTAMLSALVPLLNNATQQSFLAETMTCYGHGAYRAAVIMAWNLAYSHVCDQIFANGLSKFNAQLVKVLPKAGEITKRLDFEDFKESKIIEVARGAGILGGTSAKILKEKLDKRNTAAHPSAAKVTAITAEEVIHDLVENILLRAEL